jgi:hypothetical protein
MRHIMIDIETLSDDTSMAVITQIGAIVFDASGAIRRESLHVGLDINPQIACGRLVNDDTLRWWETQDNSPYLAATVHPLIACEKLDALVGREPVRIWANGIVFDIGNLSSLYRQLGCRVPWAYNSSVDMRTVRRMCGGEKLVDPSHSALDDAYHQAEWVADNAAGYILELERD